MDAVFATSADDFSVHFQLVAQRGAYAARTHFHKHERQIASAHAVRVEETHEQVEIGGDAKRRVVVAVLLEQALVGEKRGMRRHKPVSKLVGTECFRRIVARHLVEVVGADKHEVAVDSLNVLIVERRRNARNHIAAMIEVVGIQHSNYVARRHPDAFVHGIVEALVGLAYPTHTPAETRLICANDVDRLVARPAVDNDILQVVVVLQQDRLDGVADRRRTVVGYCYY